MQLYFEHVARLYKGLLCAVFTCMVLSASAQELPDERRVTIDFANISIDSALVLLSANSGVSIPFDTGIIPPDKRVSLSARQLMLGIALNNVFVNTTLSYKIVGNQLVIKDIPKPVIVKRVTVSGYLKDDYNGEGLVFANVSANNAQFGTTSNEYGFYSLTLPVGDYQIAYSYVGFRDNVVDLAATKDTVIDISLKTSTLDEIVIKGEVPKVSKQTEDYDQLPLNMLDGLVALGGEPDVIRMAQMRSGVSSQVDGFGGLQVRGGTADQNLVLLDGVPVYNTGHALGLFSIFNSSAIKSAKLIKGGFPARYGGRLSSIMDIRVNEGNNQKFEGDASISPLLLRASFQGPIQKGKSSYLVSARRTIIDPLLKPLSRYSFRRTDEDGEINFYFYDLNAKVNFQIDENNQVFLSGYLGQDKYSNNVSGTIIDANDKRIEELDRSIIEWGNQIATLRWNSKFNKKMFGNASLSYTRFNFDNFDFDRTTVLSNNSTPSFNSRLFSSDIEDIIAAYSVDVFFSPQYYLKAGVNYTNHKLIPGSDFSTVRTDEELLNENGLIEIDDLKALRPFEEFNGTELRAFVENELRFGKKLSFNVGAHFSSISALTRSYKSLQPRLSVQYKIQPNILVKGGYSQMDQFFHLLSTGGFGLPSDIWIPSTDVIPPEKSRQVSLGIEASFGDSYLVKVGAFDKDFSRVNGYAIGSALDISGNANWQENLPIGSGDARGIEFEFEKRSGKIKGWISYTYSKATRSFTELNRGAPFRARNDRRHLVNVNAIAKINTNMELTGSWTYSSPLPVSLPTSTIASPDDQGRIIWVPDISPVPNGTLPPYHKLDLGFNLYNQYDWGKQKLSIGAYNVYGRRNPFYVDVVFDETADRYLFEQVSILVFVPYVSFGISF